LIPQDSIGWLGAIIVAAGVIGLLGRFLYGWLHRNDPPPPGVKPLTDEDDARWR
jgi:hypothetical protein